MNAGSVLVLFGTLTIILAIMAIQTTQAWPVVRGRLEATWPMVPGAIEGFVGAEGLQTTQGITTAALRKWLPAPEVVAKPSVGDCPRSLNDAGAYEAGVGKPYKSFDLLGDWLQGKPEPRVANGPTSQKCYQVDYARGLERAGSYAQRTNNYRHGYPDSCSAPNHDLVLDFYIPKPSGPPYQV